MSMTDVRKIVDLILLLYTRQELCIIALRVVCGHPKVMYPVLTTKYIYYIYSIFYITYPRTFMHLSK